MIICYDCINYYNDFNLFAGMSEYIYFICLVVYYSPILQGDMFLYFIWRFWKISMLSPHIARDLLYWHPYTNNYVLNAWKELNISGDVCYFYKNESKKNLNNYLDLNVFMHNKINKKFFFNISYGHENISMWANPIYQDCWIWQSRLWGLYFISH